MICTQSYSSTAAKLFTFFEGERGRQPVPLEGRQFDTGYVARVFFSSALFIAGRKEDISRRNINEWRYFIDISRFYWSPSS